MARKGPSESERTTSLPIGFGVDSPRSKERVSAGPAKPIRDEIMEHISDNCTSVTVRIDGEARAVHPLAAIFYYANPVNTQTPLSGEDVGALIDSLQRAMREGGSMARGAAKTACDSLERLGIEVAPELQPYLDRFKAAFGLQVAASAAAVGGEVRQALGGGESREARLASQRRFQNQQALEGAVTGGDSNGVTLWIKLSGEDPTQWTYTNTLIAIFAALNLAGDYAIDRKTHSDLVQSYMTWLLRQPNGVRLARASIALGKKQIAISDGEAGVLESTYLSPARGVHSQETSVVPAGPESIVAQVLAEQDRRTGRSEGTRRLDVDDGRWGEDLLPRSCPMGIRPKEEGAVVDRGAVMAPPIQDESVSVRPISAARPVREGVVEVRLTAQPSSAPLPRGSVSASPSQRRGQVNLNDPQIKRALDEARGGRPAAADSLMPLEPYAPQAPRAARSAPEPTVALPPGSLDRSSGGAMTSDEVESALAGLSTTHNIMTWLRQNALRIVLAGALAGSAVMGALVAKQNGCLGSSSNTPGTSDQDTAGRE